MSANVGVSRQDFRINRRAGCAKLELMGLLIEEIRDGLRDGTVVFCMPAAHEDFRSEFLEEFSERILKQGWRDVAFRTHLQIPALLDDYESADDVMANILDEYGVDVTDLPGLPFWEVLRRCARSTPRRSALMRLHD